MRAVELIRWPRDTERRHQLATAGTPRLLLLEPGTPIPELADDEDFVRLPADERDVSARLRRLGLARIRPTRPDDRVVANRLGRVTLSEGQAAVVALLVAAEGRLTPRAEVEAAFWPGPGGPPAARALDDAVHRLRRRLRPIGLEIHAARNRGYVLGHDLDLELDLGGSLS